MNSQPVPALKAIAPPILTPAPQRRDQRRSPLPSADPDRPTWMESGRIPLLDGFRALAVFAVLLAHVTRTQGFPFRQTMASIGSYGAVGVELFFVLSGFLITTLLIRERRRYGHIRIGAFFTRRILRILPAYTALLLTVLVLQQFGIAQPRRSDWIAALTYTTNFLPHPTWELGHLWSLSIEEHFYLIWPLVFAVSSLTATRQVAVFCIVTSFVGRWALLWLAPEHAWLADTCTFTRLDTIAFGCLLALGVENAPTRRWIDRITGRRGFPGLAVLLLLLSLPTLDVSHKLTVGFGYSFRAALLTGILWSCLRRAQSPAVSWLDHRWLQAIGLRSYSLYLWQQLFLNPHQSSLLTSFPMNLLLATLAAMTCYHFVESPFLTLKTRFSGHPTVAA